MSASLAYAEALAAAVRVEENGAAFYAKAAAGASDPDAAAAFAKLAGMEEEHRGYFSALAIELEQREGIFFSDPEGKLSASIRSMAEAGISRTVKEPSVFFEGKTSVKDALEFSLGMEKDSIIFYLGLQEAIADREESDKVGGIIKEEMRHIAIISSLLKRFQD